MSRVRVRMSRTPDRCGRSSQVSTDVLARRLHKGPHMTLASRVTMVLGTIWLLSGCYRSAELPLRDMHIIRPHGESGVAVEHRSGATDYYDDVDTVEVHATDDRERAVQEFQPPIVVQVTASSLEVNDGTRRKSIPLDSVEHIRVRRFAEDRVPLIVGSAIGSALLAGAITWVAISDDCDYPGDEDRCVYDMMFTLGVGAAAFVGGFVIAIPLTAGMEPDVSVTPELRRRFPSVEHGSTLP